MNLSIINQKAKILLVGIDNSGYNMSNYTANPGGIAQQAEQAAVNRCVVGSSPTTPAKQLSDSTLGR